MPVAVVERAGKELDPRCCFVRGADRADLMLKEATDGCPVVLRPRVGRLAQESRARIVEAVRRIRVGAPAQAQLHAGAGWALAELGICISHALLGGDDQLLQRARHLSDEVVLQYLPLTRVEQATALLHLGG
jgi:D-aminopeptidase